MDARFADEERSWRHKIGRRAKRTLGLLLDVEGKPVPELGPETDSRAHLVEHRAVKVVVAKNMSLVNHQQQEVPE